VKRSLVRRARTWVRYRAMPRIMAVHPLAILAEWEWDCDVDADLNMLMTRRARFACFVMSRVRVAGAILRCLFWPKADDTQCCPLWMHALHRAKAIVCLLLGWRNRETRWRDGRYIDMFDVVEWNGRTEGYYEPEFETDSLSVGWGWRNWFVELDSGGLW
jgi:hypothetical protein